ncbi:MAG TPA: lytic transglycosylase domain-containing protein [Nitrospiria bacterium]
MKELYRPFQSKQTLIRFCLLLAVTIQFFLTLTLTLPNQSVQATTQTASLEDYDKAAHFPGWLFTGYRSQLDNKIQHARKINLTDELTFQKISKIHDILSQARPNTPVLEQEKLAALIYRESQRNGYDPELILSVIMTESSFRQYAYSNKGAIGLMQLLPGTGQALAARNQIPLFETASLYEPHLNIKLGTEYLALLHKRFGDLSLALAAYNQGPTRLAGIIYRGEQIPFGYSKKVLNGYSRFLDMETPVRTSNPVSLVSDNSPSSS